MMRRTARTSAWYNISPKTELSWFDRYVLGKKDPKKGLVPFRRSQIALLQEQLPELERQAWRLTPNMAFTYFMFGYLIVSTGSCFVHMYIASSLMLDHATVDQRSAAQRIEDNKKKDPNRMPWPVVHQQVTEMREGKRSMEDLAKLWDQTKYYYPHDWLVPVELVQVLKFSTGKLLSQYVADPEEMRKDLLVQLFNVRYGRVGSDHRVNNDVKEIITIACEDLEGMSFEDTDKIPLVPVHTAGRRVDLDDGMA